MGNSTTSPRPVRSIMPATPIPARSEPVSTPRELATQTPHVITYTLQQFVRLAGAQCRMSPAEVAYHNREHGRTPRSR